MIFEALSSVGSYASFGINQLRSYAWVHTWVRYANAITKDINILLKTLKSGARPIIVIGTFRPIDKGG